jgi:hypothetical protein
VVGETGRKGGRKREKEIGKRKEGKEVGHKQGEEPYYLPRSTYL